MSQPGQNVATLQADPDIKGRQLGLFSRASDFVNSNQAFAPFTGQRVAGPQLGQIAARNMLGQALGIGGFGFMQPQFGAPFQGQSIGGLGGTVGVSNGGGGSGVVGDTPPGGDTDPIADREGQGDDITRDPNRFGTIMNAAFGPGQMMQPTVTPSPFPLGGGGGPTSNDLPTGMNPGFGTNSTGIVGQDLTGTAAEIARQGGFFGPQQVQGGMFGGNRINQLMNPFQQNVIDQTINDLDRARQLTLQSGVGSAGAGTFGGDRSAIREGEVNRNFLDAVGRQSAQLRSAGFDRATGLQGQELGMGLQAGLANQQAGLAGQGLNLNAAGLLNQFGGDLFGRTLQGASALNQFGSQDQALAQGFTDANFQQFLDAQNQPVRQIDFLQRILSGVPQDQNQIEGRNRGAGILGGAVSGAGIGSSFGVPGALIGGGLGGLLGLF